MAAHSHNPGSQIHGGGARPDDDVESGTVASGGMEQMQVSGTDDLLDEIDGLLEENAEDFVRSYVQKGGQ